MQLTNMFYTGTAELHIPKCKNIHNRPKPPKQLSKKEASLFQLSISEHQKNSEFDSKKKIKLHKIKLRNNL